MRRLLRAEILLPVAIVGGAVLLTISEFMVTFQFTPPGGEPLRDQMASDRHSYALMLLAIFTVMSMALAIITGRRIAAIACAIFGGAALLLFLILDLPDAGELGPLAEPYFTTARTEPQPGFWLEAAGAVVIGLGSVAFATLSSEQLRAPLGSSRRRGGGGDAVDASPSPGASGPFDFEADERTDRPARSRRAG